MYSFAFTSLLGPCYHPVLSTQNSLTMAPRPACGLWIDASDSDLSDCVVGGGYQGLARGVPSCAKRNRANLSGASARAEEGGPGGAAPGKISRLQFVQTRTYAQISLGAPNPSPKYVVRMTIFTREVAIFSHRHRHPGAKKSSKKKQPLLRLPRWSPTLVLTELDDA